MKRFIVGESRSQDTLFPESLDDYVREDNPVRVIVLVTHNLSAPVAHKLSGLEIAVEVIKDAKNRSVTGDQDYEIL
jgi:hypothetical protein